MDREKDRNKGNVQDVRDPKRSNVNDEKAMVTGMFNDRESSESAYNTLDERGYTNEEINVVMSKETRDKYFSGDQEESKVGNKAAEGTGVGSAVGGTLGAITGAIAAVGTSIAIPGLGLVVAGPVAAGLAGAGAGGLTGGIIGALVGWGIPEEKAKMYEEGIKDGKIVLGVEPKSEEDAKFIEEKWRDYDAHEVHR
ncbi:MAG: hypothetical protein WEA58_09050 [Balneolaceae bacterium]